MLEHTYGSDPRRGLARRELVQIIARRDFSQGDAAVSAIDLAALTTKRRPEYIVIISRSSQKLTKPVPFRYIALIIVMKYFAGTKADTHFKKRGILSTGKTKPESIMDGRSVTSIAAINAICCVLAIVEINIPRPNVAIR